MIRRGFTLLETMLSLVVGMLVLLATLGVMSTVRDSDDALAVRAEQQHELAEVRIAVSSALSRLRPAPNNIVRDTLPDTLTDEQIEAILETPFPEPIEGLPHHFELASVEGEPRLEVVVDRLPRATYPPLTEEELAMRDPSTLPKGATGGITFNELLGFRGAFTLRASQERTAYELWWEPLPPEGLPEGYVFDESTLPEPKLLCGHVASLSWSAFIDGGKVTQVRAIEARQFPAYVELELTTTDGLYASWMFELGWIPGNELGEIDTEADTEEPELGGGS